MSPNQEQELVGVKKQVLTPEQIALMKMKPTQRWVETTPIEVCLEEYKLIQMNKSGCSSKQRQYITERVEQYFLEQKGI